MVDWSWDQPINVRSIIWEIFSEIFDRDKCVWEIKYFLQDLKSLPLDSDQEPNPVGMSPVRTRILAFHRRRHCEAPAFSLSTPRTLIPWKLRRIPSNSFCWNLLPIPILFQISLLKKKGSYVTCRSTYNFLAHPLNSPSSYSSRNRSCSTDPPFDVSLFEKLGRLWRSRK